MGEVAYEQPSSPQQSDSEVSVSSGEMETHVADTATPIEHICRWSKCEMLFVSLEDLADHVSKYHGHAGRGGLFYCGWEGCSRGQRGFNARYKMLVHVRTHTNEKPHHCFTCDKSFSRAENLKIHARSHTGERPYVCPMPGCKKAYSNSSDRFKHTRTHTVEKPYRCKVPGCPKRYTDPSSLRKHVKTYRHYPVTAGETPAIESPPPQPPASVTAPAQLGIRLQQQQQQPHPTFFAHEVPANPRPAIPTFTLMDSLTPMMPAQSSIPLWMSLGGHMSLLNPYCNTEVQKAPLELLNTYCTTEVQETPLDLTINRAACV